MLKNLQPSNRQHFYDLLPPSPVDNVHVPPKVKSWIHHCPALPTYIITLITIHSKQGWIDIFHNFYPELKRSDFTNNR